jgi:glycogen synthase kinase 3 beta
MNFINNNSSYDDNTSINSVSPSKLDNKYESIIYDADKMIGHGSFGTVFRATIASTNEVVAIKKIFQNKRFKNRELQIMRKIVKQSHPSIILLRHYFVSNGSKPDDIYINLVLDFFPETISSLLKSYYKTKTLMPSEIVITYMFQLSRALAHIHGMGICHR